MANTPILKLPFPTEDDTVDVPRDIGALANAIDPLGTVPVGAMMMWLGAVPPSGWLIMQGQAVDAATYPGLAALFGQSGGNVTIPDMRDAFPMGASANAALGAAGGAASVALSTAQIPSHSHNGKTAVADRSLAHTHPLSQVIVQPQGGQVVENAFNTYQGQAGLTSVASWVNLSITAASANAPDHQHAINAEGGGGAHENRPPFRAVNFIVRAG